MSLSNRTSNPLTIAYDFETHREHASSDSLNAST